MEHVMVQEKNHSRTVCRRIFIISTILALTSLLSNPQLDAKIYQWIDVNGVVNFSNMPPADAGSVINSFHEYPHNAVAHQDRLRADQKEIDELVEKIETEEQQASEEKQYKPMEEKEQFEMADQDQPPLFASGCFSTSYSIQQGRGAFGPIIPRDLSEAEYQNLKKLFEGIDGFWVGNALVIGCNGREGEVSEQLENYSVKSEATMYRAERFILRSDLYSRKDRSTEQQTLYLYLNKEQLASVPNIKIADIEVISVSSDELTYLEKRNIGGGTNGGGAPLHHEIITTIKKTSEISFSLTRDIFQNGSLIATSIWYLESV
jgi:hypothetical protein